MFVVIYSYRTKKQKYNQTVKRQGKEWMDGSMKKFKGFLSLLKLCATVFAVASVLMLCSCGKISGAENAAGEDAEKVKVEYLGSRIDELEKELLNEKSNSYVSDAEHRERIRALESEIADLKRAGGKKDTADTGDKSITNNTENQPTETSRDTGTQGTIVTPEEEFTYTVSDGKAIITGYSGRSVSIEIPAKLDGYPVCAIGDNAFSRGRYESIKIPASVTYIGWFAFSENVRLKSVTIPASVVKAEYGIFDGCNRSLKVFCAKGSYMYSYASSYGLSVYASDAERS